MAVSWGTLALEPGLEQTVSLGETEIRLVAEDDRYRVHVSGSAIERTATAVVGWRDIFTKPGTSLSVEPASPDLPVVLKPREPIALGPGRTVHYEVLVPTWLRLLEVTTDARKTPRKTVLLDLPTRVLKRTWFGTAESGEVAYGWGFDSRSRESYQRHHLVVPLEIRNQSQSVLWFERLLLRVVHLDLFRVHSRIETNAVTVTFKGSEQLSNINYQSTQDKQLQGAVLVGDRRTEANPDILRRSFLWLRDLNRVR